MHCCSNAAGRLFPIALVLFGTLSVGCGGDSGSRVTGKITFKGQPVPSGMVYIEPDGSQGNSGPTGFAAINNGTYDTAAAGGRPAPAGHVVFKIEGIDPNPPPNADPDITTTVLFSGYQLKAELPASGGVKDIEVPPEAALGPAQQEARPVIVP